MYVAYVVILRLRADLFSNFVVVVVLGALNLSFNFLVELYP